ncbi:MAG: CHASE2 domain-containing protein, partial [bacterium]
ALVLIDDRTTDSLPFPFDRRVYAQLIRQLNRAGARLIAFDIGFSSRGIDPQADLAFRQAIEEAGNVVLCGKIAVTYHAGLKTPVLEVKPPSNTISPGAPWGLIDDLIDPDGVTRRYPVYFTVKDTAYLSLAFKLYGLMKNIDPQKVDWSSSGILEFGDRKIPLFEANSLFLNFYGPSGTFPSYSFIDVLEGEYDYADLWEGLTDEEQAALRASGVEHLFGESPFKDKVVLVGASAEDLQDNKFTPFFSSRFPRRTPGVEIHANALQMLWDGSFIHIFPEYGALFGALVLSVILYVIGRWLGQGWAALLILIILIAVIYFRVYLFTEKGLYMVRMPLVLTLLVGYPTNLIYRVILTQKERALYRGMFSHYVQKEVVEELIRNPELVKLGGERRVMSVLFTDVAGFTTIAERMPPEALVSLLNEYLTEMSRVIVDNGGIIDKYEGDLIMAEFGAPIWREDHAQRACNAALGMHKRLAELYPRWAEEKKPLLVSRIGINSGEMLVGNMGSDVVFDYTVMGDAVNLASRLEGVNKVYGTRIIIGEETFRYINGQFFTRPLDRLRVKGKEVPVEVFELIGYSEEELSPQRRQAIEYYLKGLDGNYEKKYYFSLV